MKLVWHFFIRLSLVLALVAVGEIVLVGCHRAADHDQVIDVNSHDRAADNDPVIDVDSRDPEMQAAIQRARAEIDSALQTLQEGQVMGFSVKAPIQEGKRTEHFWLKDVTYQNNAFTGLIDNEPQRVHTVKKGDRITLRKEEISDWYYLKEGKMYGSYTTRVLLKDLPPDDAAFFQRILAK